MSIEELSETLPAAPTLSIPKKEIVTGILRQEFHLDDSMQ